VIEMYSFVDTTEYQDEGVLPAEAVKFNGKWLDHEVPGFRTLQVSGREMAMCEIADVKMGNVDGTQYQYKRYPARSITVTYQLSARSDSVFRGAYNKLNGLLNVQEAELMFNDEPDKYFIATKAGNSEIPPGRNNVTGEIVFYCTDPLKHSAVEKVFPAKINADGILEAVIINEGTASVPVSYEIVHKHENGYLGIVSEYGVMQYGDIKEVDKEVRKKSEVLLKYTKYADYSAMTDGKGILDGGHSEYPKEGTFCGYTIRGRSWLALQSSGSGSTWHGASKYVTLPPDSNGISGASNFIARAKVWFETTKVNQTGTLQLVIGDEDDKHLASIHLVKSSAAENRASAVFQIREKEVGRIKYTPSSQSVTNSENGQIYIQKSGELFEFYFGGKKYHYRSPALAGVRGHSVTIFLGQYGSSYSEVDYMFFGDISFQKNNVSYLYDIPNRYQKGSVVLIDGVNTKFYVDGVPSLEDEVRGSTYFRAPPGEARVQFFCSDFSIPVPAVTAKIREAYL